RFTDGSLTTANSGSVTVASDVASKLAVTTQPGGATAGANLTTQPVVTVQDQFGNTVTGDGSTVAASPRPGSGSLPGTLTTAADASPFAVTPAAADHLAVTNAPASVTAGSAAAVRVTARDPFGNTAPTYTGTVVFSSDDPAAGLPANYTFVGGDNGMHDFAG